MFTLRTNLVFVFVVKRDAEFADEAPNPGALLSSLTRSNSPETHVSQLLHPPHVDRARRRCRQ